MIQEEKDLLVKDLAARVPYGVKISVNNKVETLQGINILDNIAEYGSFLSSDIEEVKPYLFPLSSMAEEQKNQLKKIWSSDMDKAIDYSISGEDKLCDLCQLSAAKKVIDWLIANYFDYKGLIPMGLAEDATGLNIY